MIHQAATSVADPEQRRVGIHVDLARFAIDLQSDHERPPICVNGETWEA